MQKKDLIDKIGVSSTTIDKMGKGEKVSFLRFTFSGKVISESDRPLDPDILRAVWMTYDEILASRHRHRSKLVLQSIEDYLKGQTMPLSMLSTWFVERK